MKSSELFLNTEQAANARQYDEYCETMQHEKNMGEEQEYFKNKAFRNNFIFMVVLAEPELSPKIKGSSSIHTVEILHIRLALHWTELKPEERLADAGFKVAKWNASTYCPQPFPANIPTLVVYGGLITDLKSAIEAVGSNRPSKEQKVAIEKASKKLQTATSQIMTVWQNKADSDVVNAISIACDGGFDYTVSKARGPRKSGLWRSTEPGVMVGTLAGKGWREWQQTDDGGQTWKYVDTTSGGVVVLSNLTTGTRYGLRGRLTMSKGRKGPWSDWMYEYAP